ncbi:MAG TPA: 4Fe-4S binding protein [Myxococcota bacterium]|nr:4Fe-4S binding protein [Myxococcota bacterium]
MKSDVCKLPGGSGPGLKPRERSAGDRSRDFREVVECYTLPDAQDAARRCLMSYTCTFCEVCELLCPDQCITRDPENGDILIDLEYCKGCGLCTHFCPRGAIEMVVEK